MHNPHAEHRATAIVATLKQCPLFRQLSPEVLKEIAEFTVIKSLVKGEILFREGDESVGFYVVQKGTINVHRVNALGKEQVIHLFRAGESFAEGSLATDVGYPADAQAMESTQLLLVHKEGFVALICQHPKLAMRMLASMSMHLRDLVGQIDDLKLKSVETRLANWLIKRCPDPESEEPFPLTLTIVKRVLAQEIGTVSETLSRTLAKLRDDGLLSVDGKVITIHSPANLTALLRRHLGE
jgi:CRP-like cAMP-binding protein